MDNFKIVDHGSGSMKQCIEIARQIGVSSSSLDSIRPAELAKLRYVLDKADYLTTEELDRVCYIETSARMGSVDEVSEELNEMYLRLRNKSA